MKFLQQIASLFYNQEGAKIRELCFVFPNRRSGLFFRKYLGEIAREPVFSPGIFTIKDFIISLSDLRESDKFDLLFRLYRIYKQTSGSSESFDDFVYWGEVILNDFNDTDKFMADARLLFANIKELKEIESDYSFLSQTQLEAVRSFWEGFLPVGDSDNKQKFKALWQVLYPLYTELRKDLIKDGCGYEGMIFRDVAENKSLTEKTDNFREVIFVGLNALNECEKTILKSLKKSGKADFYWDYAGDFVKDINNKASQFMQENLSLFPSKRSLVFEKYPIPQINIIAVSSAVMQAKIVSEILNDNPLGIENAVVLPDEKMLLPMLHSVPEQYRDVNVTMGYPLKGTPVMSLIEFVISLEKDKGGYYHKRVIPLLKHSFVKLVNPDVASSYLKRIISSNLIYITPEFFSDNEFLSLLFSKVDNNSYAYNLCTKLHDILDFILKNSSLSKLDREFFYHIKVNITRISGILIPMSPETFGRLLSQLLSSVSIPFSGEPLCGLQIMGVLETRGLDFDNVLYCSMNEGIFPSSSHTNSFIPYNLRRGFSLPVREYNDAIASYHFYRSIYRAKKVWLLYDTRTEGLNTGEMSRFILQLKYHYNIPVSEKSVSFKVRSSLGKIIEIEKTSEITRKMETKFLNHSGKPLSATALGTYITCPLQFYFSYIEEVKEEDEISEEVESNEFGSIFHYIMERLYNRFKGSVVNRDDILKIIKDDKYMERLAEEGFMKFKNLNELKGYNLLIKKLLIKYVNLTLEYDLSLSPFEYLDSEKRVLSQVETEDGMIVPLKGVIDRIDRTNGVKRVVDYKTGKGEIRFSLMEDLFDAEKYQKKKVAFQMLFYAMILSEKDPVKISPYVLRNFGKNGSQEEMLIDSNEIENFREHLKDLIAEIFNPQINFYANRDSKACDWCPYSPVCY